MLFSQTVLGKKGLFSFKVMSWKVKSLVKKKICRDATRTFYKSIIERGEESRKRILLLLVNPDETPGLEGNNIPLYCIRDKIVI